MLQVHQVKCPVCFTLPRNQGRTGKQHCLSHKENWCPWLSPAAPVQRWPQLGCMWSVTEMPLLVPIIFVENIRGQNGTTSISEILSIPLRSSLFSLTNFNYICRSKPSSSSLSPSASPSATEVCSCSPPLHSPSHVSNLFLEQREVRSLKPVKQLVAAGTGTDSLALIPVLVWICSELMQRSKLTEE